jgi:ribosomal protein S18 acetylase RimI-like enzyme
LAAGRSTGLVGENMARMTDEEAEYWDEYYTTHTPKLGPNGTGFLSQRERRFMGLDQSMRNTLMKESIPDKNLFMMCAEMNRAALSELPQGYHIRNIKEDELDIWKAMPFDEKDLSEKYYDYMTNYFNAVYSPKRNEFFNKCLFVCDHKDKPAGTCFIWKAYDKINTIQWLKILKGYEGRGLGRALLSAVMKPLQKDDYPVYLHTQPSSYRAIKLYADFGFSLLSDPVIGGRKNVLDDCLKILQDYMPKVAYEKLKITTAPKYFLDAVNSSKVDQF